MPVILKCKTDHAYDIKILSEILNNNIKIACFVIDITGIKLSMMDHHRTILIDFVLESENFTSYRYKSNEKTFIGITMSHLYKMLKIVKKRDSLQFLLDSDNPTDLEIKITPKENNRSTTLTVKIHEIQNIEIDIPDGYGKLPIMVPSAEFQKMCKGMLQISPTTTVMSKGNCLRFSSDSGDVMKRFTEFGQQSEESDDDEKTSDDPDYSDVFDTDQLVRITKMAGLAQNIQIYTKQGNPLLLKCPINSLGKLRIFLKSKTLQEEDAVDE